MSDFSGYDFSSLDFVVHDVSPGNALKDSEMNLRQVSTTTHPIMIFMADEEDGKTGLTGLTLAVTLSKDGGTFAAAAGAVTERGSGWYALAGNAIDRGTLGELIVKATATGADAFYAKYNIVPYDPYDVVRMGLTGLPNAVAGANGGLPLGNGSGQVDVGSVAAGAVTSIQSGLATTAQLGTELSDALRVDTIPELAQGVPAAQPTFATALMLMYMSWRNGRGTTEASHTIKNDAGVVVAKAAISDDGTTLTVGKLGSGP
jgi:hypothetical protein